MISANEARKTTEETRLKLQKSIDEINYYIDYAIYQENFQFWLMGLLVKRLLKF